MKTEHIEERYGIRKESQEFPMMSVMGLSYVCNALCPTCPYTNSDIRSDYKDTVFMSEDTFKIIADQCGEYGAWVRISGGGEPMLHPQAVELIEYAKKVGAKVGLITNQAVQQLHFRLKSEVKMSKTLYVGGIFPKIQGFNTICGVNFFSKNANFEL